MLNQRLVVVQGFELDGRQASTSYAQFVLKMPHDFQWVQYFKLVDGLQGTPSEMVAFLKSKGFVVLDDHPNVIICTSEGRTASEWQYLPPTEEVNMIEGEGYEARSA